MMSKHIPLSLVLLLLLIIVAIVVPLYPAAFEPVAETLGITIDDAIGLFILTILILVIILSVFAGRGIFRAVKRYMEAP